MRRAFAISIGVHALALLLLLIGGRFSLWPAPPIPIEVQARSVARPPEPAPQPQAERPHASDGESPAPRRRRETKSAASGTPAPPPTSDLKPYAPDDANLVVLLRSEKLRKSPHRQAAEALLAGLPDYHTLLAGTGLSPIDDFEALLIATADPRDMTATFVAARYKDDARIRAIGERPLMAGDPRVFRFLSRGLAVLVRPDQAAKLDGEPLDGGSDDARRRWLKQLAEFDRVAATDAGPAVLVTLSDVPALLSFGTELPTPLALALATTAEASPALRVKAVFAGEPDAQRMESAWPDVMRRYRTATALIGLATMLDGIKLERRGAEIELQGRIPEPQFRLALSWAQAFLPRAPVDGGAP
jgi:hypothetical protein